MADLAVAIEQNETAKQYQVEVKTRESKRAYSARILDGNGRLVGAYMLALTEQDMVWIYTAETSVGLYYLARFGGELSPNSIRQFFLNSLNK